MIKWYMLTLVGEDRKGIVAEVTSILFQLGYDLGEASMMRLGGNFTIMLMVKHPENRDAEDAVSRIQQTLDLRTHVDPVKGGLHQHVEPNLRVSVFGTDRPGIVAQVTGELTEQGVNILDLESDVGGSAQNPIFIMHIEGQSDKSLEAIKTSLRSIDQAGIDIQVSDFETLVG